MIIVPLETIKGLFKGKENQQRVRSALAVVPDKYLYFKVTRHGQQNRDSREE
jgi:hypothetical protein